MLGLLQIKSKGSIVLVNAGSFYIARGKDALLLNQLLDLKLNCLEMEVCKVGFPINSLDKYTKLIEKKNYSYIVYNYDNVLNKLSILKEYSGKYKNEIKEERNNCYTCTNSVKMYRKTDKYMEAHYKSRKGKGYRKDVILFNLKQEEYIMWLYEKLKNKTYKHGGYTIFYVTEPKLRKIEKSKYIDRIVHRWLVDNYLIPIFVPQFISTSYACLKDKGMHKACIQLQLAMKKCKII